MSNIQLAVHDGRITTTSLTVAEHFGREHRDVMKAVRNLDCSDEFAQRNFSQCTYRAGNGRNEPAIEMTRDGCMFLTMGFTGPEAARIKESFIAAFNSMEAELSAQVPRPGQVEALETRRLRDQVDQLKDELLESQRRQIALLAAPKRTRKATIPVTQQDVEKILRLRAQGLSGNDIARQTGRSNGTVSFILRGAGATLQGNLL